MNLAQIGEFAFLIASIGPGRSVLLPVAVSVSVLTAFLTPYLARSAQRAGPLVDQRLPRPLRTFLSLYATWLESMRTQPSETTLWSRVRRTVAWMLLDSACIVGIVIGVAVSLPSLEKLLDERFGIAPHFIELIVAIVATVAIVPFAFGVFRCVRRLGELLATHVLPSRAGLDLAHAPRRAMLAALQFGLLLLVAVPVLAVTQPFVPALPSAGVLLLVLALAFWALWKSATNLEGHVRAGAAVVLEVLASQSREARPSLESIHDLLPGLGPLTPVRLTASDAAVGRTVAEVNLHGHSGATILCISRGREGTVAPTPDKTFEAGDVLTLTGTAQAIATAREVLAGRTPDAPSPRG
jgi:CPA2 family monovalent cation:H+ antiporter-2